MAKQKKISYDLFGKLQLATIEREVEDAWNGGISLFFADSPIEHPFACDGFIQDGLLLRLIIEYKYDEKLSVFAARARVLVQVLFYLKRFEEGGLPLPNVIMVADKNECFVIHTNHIQDYLDEKIDWSTAPSAAADANPKLVAKIAANEDINPFIFTVGPNFDLKPVINRIHDLAVNVKRYVRVTEHNIAQIFDYYTSNVLRDSTKLTPHELVESFMGVLLEPMDYYQHPKDKNALVTKNGKIPIHGDAFISFFDFYNQTYTPQEKMKFTEITDRLIEDVTRRQHGEFFTPTPFVDYAHRMLEKELGSDWKEKYVVWDCCCGTKNLTRDYKFRELYCSTLIENDLNLCERYNPEATSFQFNFLDGDMALLPEGLKDALEKDKPICFFLNPPYARNSGDNSIGTSEQVCYTPVRTEMNKNGMDACAANLYAQFLYKIYMLKEEYHLTNCALGVFCPTLFLTGVSFKNFRKVFLENFRFLDAIQFKASYFADVQPSWGISFSVWQSGITTNKGDFLYTLVDKVETGIKAISTKNVYNIDHALTASVWLREETKNLPTSEYVELTSAIKVRSKDGSRKGKLVPGALGYFYNKSNNVDKNTSGISLFSAAFSDNVGTSIIPSNFYKCVTLFAARKLILKNWINSKDEYLAPDESHAFWNEFVGDSIVYSLFHSSSNQSSLRRVEYHGRLWDIKNEFFWLSRDRIEKLANDNGNMDCYADTRTDTDRFVYKELKKYSLSEEAKAVLKKANVIIEKTFPYRQLFNSEHPEYQINNWDCGWYQVKALAAQYAKKDLDEFKVLYKALSDKMTPMVYDLGFLLR